MYLTRRTTDFIPAIFNELLDWNLNTHIPATPKMNVIENEGNYELEFCTPGLSKEELNICLEPNNNLTVKIAQKQEQESEKKNYLRKEFSTMEFQQTFTLPEDVNVEQIGAKIENGILRITLPKVLPEERRSETKLIEIQ